MRRPTLSLAFFLLAAPLLAQSPGRAHNNLAYRRTPAQPAPLTVPLTPEEQSAQIVNRFTFAATPGLVAAITAEGWEHWFAQQLQPESIPDAELDKRLARYPSLAMSPEQIAVNFPDGQVIRRIADGKQAMPADPQLAGVYQVLLARYGQKQQAERAETNNGAPQPGATPDTQTQAQQQAAKAARDAEEKTAEQVRARTLAGPILAVPAADRLNAVLALPVPDRMALTRGLGDPLKTQLLDGTSPRDRELWAMMAGGYAGSGVAVGELEQAKVLRAVLSERQLGEVMTDFWLNHFNVDISKSGDMTNYAAQYEQAVIRPHALGHFRDLLLATAQSPAMMIYLDNLSSVGPDSPAAAHGARGAKSRAGLNENYGREVMELHTLGVDGGYTQADVTALAAILTGWGVDRPNQGGPFLFNANRHEPGAKQWLRETIPDGGQQEGLAALALLANEPATAHHISWELAQRFVADAPPPALVDRMTAAWMRSDGDIAEVLRAMVHSPEFFSRANFNSKVKTPLEFVASAMRATGTDPANPGALVQQLRAMGEAPYRCQPPTGYPQAGSSWMNSAALIDRLNFALALANGKLGGMHLDAPLLLSRGLIAQSAAANQTRAAVHTPTPTTAVAFRATALSPTDAGDDRALAAMEQALFAGAVSPTTNNVIHAQLARRDASADERNPLPVLDASAAMILGSPEFQVH